jgi:hypothetical protein
MSIARLMQASLGVLALSIVALDVSYSQPASPAPEALSSAQAELQGRLAELLARADRLLAELTAEKVTLQVTIESLAAEREALNANRFSDIEALGVQVSRIENPAITLRLSELDRSTKELLWRSSHINQRISALTELKNQIGAMLAQTRSLGDKILSTASSPDKPDENTDIELELLSVSLNMLHKNYIILDASLVTMSDSIVQSYGQSLAAPTFSGAGIKNSIDDIWDPAKTWGVQ